MTNPRKLTEQELDALDSASEGMDYMVCEAAAARLRYVEQQLSIVVSLLTNETRCLACGQKDAHQPLCQIGNFLAESDDA